MSTLQGKTSHNYRILKVLTVLNVFLLLLGRRNRPTVLDRYEVLEVNVYDKRL